MKSGIHMHFTEHVDQARLDNQDIPGQCMQDSWHVSFPLDRCSKVNCS